MAAVALRRATPTRRVSPGRPQAPTLRVVPRRRRWPAVLAVLAWTVVCACLLAAAVFHTQLAERQLRIDRLERAVAAERERFDELRFQRAELRSPGRLAEAAAALGMERGDATTFVEVDAIMLARQLAAAGAIDDGSGRILIDTDPLDQFRAVKAVTDTLEATP